MSLTNWAERMMGRRQALVPTACNVEVKRMFDLTEGIDLVHGTVKFFNPDRGFGFIKRDGQDDLFFHVANYCEPELEGFTLRWKERKLEQNRVKVKPRFISDPPVGWYMGGDDVAELHQLPPASKTIVAVKLPHDPVAGETIAYTEGYLQSRHQAVFWSFELNLAAHGAATTALALSIL